MKRPSLGLLPIFFITPSLTATTGAPLRAKMFIPRRVGEDWITSAAFPYCLRAVVELRSAWRAEMSSA
jgi:hypothetical protein